MAEPDLTPEGRAPEPEQPGRREGLPGATASADDAADGARRRRRQAETTEVASDAEVRDELPDDLVAQGYVGPYVFPNNNRRRIPAAIYVVLGVGCIVGWAVGRSDEAVVANEGVLAVGIGLVLFGAYAWQAGFDLAVDERDALVEASRAVGFPVGHASAQLGWRGIRSRPTWRILLYSAEDPPATRGLVLVDGVDGTVLEHFTEANPEDWSDLDAAATT